MAGKPFEIQQLRCFVAVAEELNFRRAAERMNMTQPPLSRHIRQLEHELGVALFDRNTRTVRLTAAGQNLLFNAYDLLNRAESAKLSAIQAARGEAGEVALGFVPSAATVFVPLIVKALAKHVPGLKLQLSEMMSYELTDAIPSGKLDLGITRLPSGTHTSDIRLIVREPFLLAVPRSHPLADMPNLKIEHLNGVDLISFSSERGGVLAEILGAMLSMAGVVPNIKQWVSQSHAVIGLVNVGIGVALVPHSTSAITMDNVVYRDIELPDNLSSDLYLALGPKQRSELNENAVQIIIDALSDYTAETVRPHPKT